MERAMDDDGRHRTLAAMQDWAREAFLTNLERSKALRRMDELKWDGSVESLGVRFNRLRKVLKPSERDSYLVIEKFHRALPTEIYRKILEAGSDISLSEAINIAMETEATLVKMAGADGEWSRTLTHRSDLQRRGSDQRQAPDRRFHCMEGSYDEAEYGELPEHHFAAMQQPEQPQQQQGRRDQTQWGNRTGQGRGQYGRKPPPGQQNQCPLCKTTQHTWRQCPIRDSPRSAADKSAIDAIFGRLFAAKE